MSTEQMMTANQMETPKAPIGVFQLPCGYLDLETNTLIREVEVRELTGVEEDMMTSKQVPNEQKLSLLLASCTKRIGSITDRGRIAEIVKDLMVGDRVYLLFAVRRVTLGDELPIRQKCPECKVSNLYIVDLGNIDIKKMPNPRKRVYDAVLPSGGTARFRVSTGRDEVKAVKLQKQRDADAGSTAIMMRLELLNGEPPTLQALKLLSFRDRAYLREQFDEVEGGVDTGIDFECPSCGHEWEDDLQIGAGTFFSLSGTQKR